MSLTLEERDALQYESKVWFTTKLSSLIYLKKCYIIILLQKEKYDISKQIIYIYIKYSKKSIYIYILLIIIIIICYIATCVYMYKETEREN